MRAKKRNNKKHAMAGENGDLILRQYLKKHANFTWNANGYRLH